MAAAEPGQTRVHLPGGSGGVWRVSDPQAGAVVHRPAGPWSAAVHELLRHLRAAGLSGVPQVYGFSRQGLEVLSYLPGTTPTRESAPVSDAQLLAAVKWLRQFHDAVQSFPRQARRWRQGERALQPGEIICHNDPGVYNWVLCADEFVGMIDWDRAGPGLPHDDLAFLSWSGVPLFSAHPPEFTLARLRLVAAGYGGISPLELLLAVLRRMELVAARWRAGLAANDPGTVALQQSGVMAQHTAQVADFQSRLPLLRAELARVV